MAEEWTDEQLRMRFEGLRAMIEGHGGVQCYIDHEDLDWILKRDRFAPPCTCEVKRSYGPDPVDEAEQDIFCPRHHLPLEELRDLYLEARSWMPEKA